MDKLNTKKCEIVTVVLQSSVQLTTDNDNRLQILKDVVEKYRDKSEVILFPAGYFDYKKYDENQIIKVADDVRKILEEFSTGAVVCFGIDCKNGKDQLAVAVNRNEILAMGRKFYPTKEDKKEEINKAEQFNDMEMGFTRIFKTCDKRFYIAVCYDCFGIRHRGIENPGVDAVLVLVHRFCKRGEGPSGNAYFARSGFAGAFKQWNCPVFGTAVFYDREIPPDWPTGIRCENTEISIRSFKYSDNKLHWNSSYKISVGQETALCYEYDI